MSALNPEVRGRKAVRNFHSNHATGWKSELEQRKERITGYDVEWKLLFHCRHVASFCEIKY